MHDLGQGGHGVQDSNFDLAILVSLELLNQLLNNHGDKVRELIDGGAGSNQRRHL